ncbi:MAG: dienelactone hydrolase family protein, partial [Pseudomonadota bacterium]|nr:dienelactone hydrolase family protein [Pseudomonadota bacterium]
ANNSSDERGGFSVYVPEYYAGEAVPLVFALHGGSGHGRQFIWSWLRAARSLNCIVIAPTSLDNTWSLMDPGADAQRLHNLVDYAKTHWNIDSEKVLLSGMSDGGTFSYVAGLQDQVPFTHLAPCSASFHPMLIEATSPERLQGLPIYLIHGALDWMFPVDVARTAQQALQAAGAAVVYAEVEDLSHTYPEEYSAKVLDWLKT